jgi:hypothetical protein
MAITAQEVFAETAQTLPPTERLRLAALILQDLARADVAVVDSSDIWNEQDQSDVTVAALRYAAKFYPEEDELV